MSKTTIFGLFSDACAEMNIKVELLRQKGELETKHAGVIISHQLTRIFTICDCAAAVNLDFTYEIENGVITSVKSSAGSTWCCKAWNSDLQEFCESLKEESP